MLDQLQNQTFNLPSPRRAYQPDPDAHSHSPRHRNSMQDDVRSRLRVTTPVVYQQYTGPISMPTSDSYVPRPYWSQVSTALDTSIDNGRYDTYGRWAAASSSGDQSIPDCSHSSTPISSRSVSNNQEFNWTASQMLTDEGIFDSAYHGPIGPIGSG